MSGCAISRPRNSTVTLTLSPESRNLAAWRPFRFQVVIVDLRANPNFLQLDHVLMLARLALFAALLVPELAVIHHPANRRDRISARLLPGRVPVLGPSPAHPA